MKITQIFILFVRMFDSNIRPNVGARVLESCAVSLTMLEDNNGVAIAAAAVVVLSCNLLIQKRIIIIIINQPFFLSTVEHRPPSNISSFLDLLQLLPSLSIFFWYHPSIAWGVYLGSAYLLLASIQGKNSPVKIDTQPKQNSHRDKNLHRLLNSHFKWNLRSLHRSNVC